ncbi:MAG TPA: anti-sigma factor [Mesorhizobium sp.]|jgi:anti-sigma-K factor RskA|nr:anti-sigma factor [Mesorhizobium sp.]
MTPVMRHEQVADYVLGTLEPAQAEAFEAAMARDPSLAQEVAEGMRRLHALDDTAELLAADDALWLRIDRSIGQVERPGERRASALNAAWDSLRFWRWAGLGGLAASAALAAGLVALVLAPEPAPRFVAILVPADGSPAGAIVEVDADGGARLIPLQDIPVPEGRALEVWTLPSPQSGPVSVGLIEEARRADLAIGGLPAVGEDQLFEITLEPETGSPIGRPTGPVLFKGLTVQAL